MIVPDLNLVVYAHNADAPDHREARAWWEGLLNGGTPVGLPWAVVLGFIRLMTHRCVLVKPMSTAEALAHVREWFAQPPVERLDPGPKHLDVLARLLVAVGAAGNLTTDGAS